MQIFELCSKDCSRQHGVCFSELYLDFTVIYPCFFLPVNRRIIVPQVALSSASGEAFTYAYVLLLVSVPHSPELHKGEAALKPSWPADSGLFRAWNLVWFVWP